MTGWLDGRRALVVGAGSGIGRAVVDAFRAEGADVAVLEKDAAKCAALREQIPGMPVVTGDATTRADNETAVQATLDAFTGLDVLVNCVGIFDFYRGISDLDADLLDDAFDEMFTVNVKSHLHAVKAALPALRRSANGSVILTESTSAYYPGRGGVLYVSSKFAVRGLVTALAHELAPEIRVNGVAPGGTLNTDLRGLASLGLGDRSLGATPGREAELAGRVPLKVALSGADHAWSYVFLASERSRGITGDVVHPDGGIAVRAETVVSLQGRDIDLLKNGMTLCHSGSNLQEAKGAIRPPWSLDTPRLKLRSTASRDCRLPGAVRRELLPRVGGTAYSGIIKGDRHIMRARIWASDNGRPPTAARQGGRRWPAQLTAISAAALTAVVAGCSGAPGSSASGSSSGGSASGSTYTIHAVVSQTGSASFLGSEEAAALNALAKHVNATGGIDGHQLAFAISDNQSTAATSVSLASPLVSQAPVLLVGSVTSTDKPVDDLTASNGPVIYDLSPGDHPKPGTFVFSSSNSTTNQIQAFINFAASKGWKKIGAISSTDSSGQDGWTNIQNAVAKSNGTVTISDHEAFDPKAVSATTELSKIKATNPQAVIVWTTGTPLGTVLNGMQQLGMDSLPTMTTNGNASNAAMQRLAGELPAQLYFPGAPFMAGVQNLTGQTKAEVQAFDTAMQAAGQKVPDEGDALSWDPGLILVSALKKLGTDATASQIHQYISSLTNFAGINGTYNFTDTSIPDNRGLAIDSVYVAQWNKSQGIWTAASGPAGKGNP